MKTNIADTVKAEFEAAIRQAIEDWKRDTNGIVLEQNPNNSYEYTINIKMATYLIKKFLATPDASGEQLIADISRYLVQVKPDRANVRNLRPTSFVPFNYRVA